MSSRSFVLLGLVAFVATAGTARGQDLLFADGFEDATCAWSAVVGWSDACDLAFRIETPEIQILAGQEITYCYYFRTPNTETVGIGRWVSTLGPGVRQAVLFLTPDDVASPGTVSAANCGFRGTARWAVVADAGSRELAFPPDDGFGQPLAMKIGPSAAGYLMMHIRNLGADPLVGRVVVDAYHRPGVVYTETYSYVTYNSNISLPPGNGHVVSRTCATPAGAKFWRLSTNTHKQAVRAVIKDGSKVVFETDDWQRPGAATFAAPDFFSFSTDQLTYECTYNNTTNRTITSGNSQATDEVCMAIGYFVPGTVSIFCNQ